MSNFIPMVSSSPPPFDDQSFGWGDDDDDFGNFTGADNRQEESVSPPHFVTDRGKSSNEASQDSTETTSSIQKSHLEDTNENSNGFHVFTKSDTDIMANGDDDFADFRQFEDDEVEILSSSGKPHPTDLPLDKKCGVQPHCSDQNQDVAVISDFKGESKHMLQITADDTQDNGSICDSKSPTFEEKETNRTSGGGTRDSTTDSGMYSTDISPIPKSEDTAEFCDKSCGSDNDETFPDLPPDSKADTDSQSHSVMNFLKSDTDLNPCSESDFGVDSFSMEVSGVIDDCSLECDTRMYEGEFDDTTSTVDVDVTRTETSFREQIEDEETLKEVSDIVGAQEEKDVPSNDEHISEFRSAQASQEASEAHTESSGQTDCDDWGDFDSADSGQQLGEPSEQENLSGEENLRVSEKTESFIDIQTTKEQENVPDEETNNPLDDDGDVNGQWQAQTQDIVDLQRTTSQSGREDSSDGSVGSQQHDQDSDCEDLEKQKEILATSVAESVSKLSFMKKSTEEKESSNEDSEQSETSGDAADDSHSEANNSDINKNETFDLRDCNVDRRSATASPSEEFDKIEHTSDDWDSFGNFAEFQSSEVNDKNSEWASFQELSRIDASDALPPLELPVIEKCESNASEDSDGFGEFSTGTEVVKNEKTIDSGDAHKVDTVNSSSLDNDDWASFDDPQVESFSDGGFDQFRSKPVQTSQVITSLHSKEISGKVDLALSGCFPTESADVKPVPGSLDIVDNLLSAELSTRMHPSLGKRHNVQVWGRLKDLDKTSALVYQWSSSFGNKQMFRTLKIDTQNILLGHKKTSVPIFAANLSLLEPIRGPVDAKKGKQKLDATLVDPNKVDSPQTESVDIPPVEFDWDNSGLTNPLAAKTLDLDFLTVQETENASKNTVFQSEMLDAPRSSVRSLPPLEDVLKNMKLTSTTTRTKKEENLGTEAGRIIDSLPILSFMQAKVLMFPLRQTKD